MTTSTTATKGEREFPYGLGSENQYSIWVRDESGTHTPKEYNFTNRLTSYKIEREENRIWKFDFNVARGTVTDENYLVRGNTVKIFFHDVCLLVGKIISITKGTDQIIKATGIGKVAYLLSNTLKTSRTEYTNTASNTIVNNIVSGSGVTVDTNENYGNINTRIELDNEMQLLINHVNALNQDWWESWGNNPYNSNIINVANNKETTDPVFTFQKTNSAGDNVVSSKREKEEKKLVNYVLALGYGDGDTQLQSICFHATNTRTTLASAITSTDTIITLDDASGFPSSGSVWIGCEKISYTGKSGNDLTGCTRGVDFLANVTAAYSHDAGIAVYDAQYDESSPEIGSSINTYGLIAKKSPNRNIVDQNALDRIAQILIDTYNTPPEKIIIKPTASAIRDVLKTVEPGHYVTHQDDYANITNGNYKVVNIICGRNSMGKDMTELHLSERFENPQAMLENMTINLSREAGYTQGAPCYIPLNIYENADGSNYGIIRAFIPSELTFIKKAELRFILTDYRGYIDVAGKTSSEYHNHTIANENAHYHGIGTIDSSWEDAIGTSANIGSTGAGTSHTHGGGYTGNHTHNHTIADVGFSIKVETLTNPSVNIYIGEYGGSMEQVGSTHTDANTMITQDIKSRLEDIGTGKMIEIQFRCNKNMRIECSGYILGHLKP